jgi:putative protein kinase ArgK-like GTPase of G3E family
VYERIRSHHDHLRATGELEQRRRRRLEKELHRKIEQEFKRVLWEKLGATGKMPAWVDAVRRREVDPNAMARRIAAECLAAGARRPKRRS